MAQVCYEYQYLVKVVLLHTRTWTWNFKILSRASEVGSPTNPPWAPGSDKTRGQGSFGPFTGGPDLLGSLQPAELTSNLTI